jgi:hypothetical protein
VRLINLFPIITFLQYLFEGFLIVAFVDLFFHEGALLSSLGVRSDSNEATHIAVEFLSIVIFTIVGHANSTIAHMVFQEGLASFKYSRPSYFFLNLIGDTKEAGDECKSQFILRNFGWMIFRVWKPFGEKESEAIRDWLLIKKYKVQSNDRDVFSRGFGKLFSSGTNDSFKELLLNFSFARNMMSTLILIGFLYLLSVKYYRNSIEAVAGHLGICPSESGGLMCHDYRSEVVFWVYFICLASLIVRFLYFFGVISKNAIRAAVDLDVAKKSLGTYRSPRAP